MPMLLKDAVADLSLWSVGSWKNGKFCQTAPLLYKDVQDLIQLIPSSKLEECYTAFAPNVFKGNGEEDRKGIMLNVSDSARVSLELLEDRVRELLEKDYPKIAAWWHSSCKTPWAVQQQHQRQDQIQQLQVLRCRWEASGCS